MDGYQEALEEAGAVVHCFANFGSYQGDWWAKVTYNGKTGWVHGYFGSCSGCDAFSAEFGWLSEQSELTYKQRLADFGKGYLIDIITQESAEAKASENLSWDGDAQEMLEFIKSNKEK